VGQANYAFDRNAACLHRNAILVAVASGTQNRTIAPVFAAKPNQRTQSLHVRRIAMGVLPVIMPPGGICVPPKS